MWACWGVMSASQQDMVERLAARAKEAAAKAPDDKLRSQAYHVAESISRGMSTDSPATKRLGDAYFQAVDRSKSEKDRAKAAKALREQLQTEVDHAETHITVMSRYVKLFEKVEKEHDRTPWPAEPVPPRAASDDDSLLGAVREFQAALDDRCAGGPPVVLDLQNEGQRLTNLDPGEVKTLRQDVKRLVPSTRTSVRQWTRGSTAGWTDIRAEGATGEEYLAVLQHLKKKGYATLAGIAEEMQRVTKHGWDFAPGGISVFKPYR